MPFASSAAMTPPSTSPVPAVASIGALSGFTTAAAVGRRDDRVVALEHDDRLCALGRLARVAQPRRLHGVALDVEEPPELARVGRQDRRRAARRERLEPGRVGVEAVGVEDERDLRAGRNLARELLRLVLAADPRAEDERAAAARRLDHRVGAVGDVVSGAVGERARHRLRELDGEDGLLGARDEHGDVARARAHRAEGGEGRGAGEPARPARDDDVAGRELRPRPRAARDELQDRGADEPGGGLGGRALRHADVDDLARGPRAPCPG